MLTPSGHFVLSWWTFSLSGVSDSMENQGLVFMGRPFGGKFKGGNIPAGGLEGVFRAGRT
jgi:hypothetical protein